MQCQGMFYVLGASCFARVEALGLGPRSGIPAPDRYAAKAPGGRPGTGACAVVTVVQLAAHGQLDALGEPKPGSGPQAARAPQRPTWFSGVDRPRPRPRSGNLLVKGTATGPRNRPAGCGDGGESKGPRRLKVEAPARAGCPSAARGRGDTAPLGAESFLGRPAR